jgi:hypothetical protein
MAAALDVSAVVACTMAAKEAVSKGRPVRAAEQ